MNQRNKQLEEVLNYFNRKVGDEKIEYVNVSFEDDYLTFSLPDHKTTQRAMDLLIDHSSRVPDEAKAYVSLATTSGRSMGVYSFPKILECPEIGRSVPGLALAKRLFEDDPTKARICVYPTDGSMGDLLDVEFSGQEITNKEAGTWRYQNRLNKTQNMNEVIDLAFDIYHS